MKKGKNVWDRVLRYEDIKPYLGSVKVFVPGKRKYYIETLYSHYAHTHYAEQLDETRKIVKNKYPEYIDSFDKVMKQTGGYMFNMMILEKHLLNEYCMWLFDILDELEKSVDMSGLSAYQGRCYGRVSEIIFNVWLDYKVKCGELKKDMIMEIPCVHMEKINWRKKGMAFFAAKFMGRRYAGSF